MSKELKPYNEANESVALQLSTSSQSGASPGPGMQLRRYLEFLSRKWWIVLLSVLSFGALAAAYIAWWPDTFGTTAHMWAAGQMGIHLNEGTTYSEDNLTYAGTQIELLRSDLILGRGYNRVTNSLHMAFPLDSEGVPILPKINISQLPRSAVLELKAKGASPELTVAFLDAVMEEFIAYKREIRAASSGDTYTSVSEQIKKQEADLTAEQNRLTAFMRDNNVAVLEERAKAASAYLTQLMAESSDLKVQLQLLETLIAQESAAAAAGTNAIGLNVGDADSRQIINSLLPTATAPPEFLTAQQELEKFRILRARLSLYLRPEHPKIVKLDEQITQAERLVDFFSQQSQDQLGHVEQTTKAKLDRLQESIKEWEAKVNDASIRIAECEQLRLNVTRLQELHDHLLSLLQTVDISKNLDQESITILDHASEPKSAKHGLAIAVLLVLVGLGTGLGVVFLLQQSNDCIDSMEILSERSEQWIVGMLPEISVASRKRKLLAGGAGVDEGLELILADDDRRHLYVESYRNLRSALIFLPEKGDRPKIMAITSSIPNEGKSTVAANLAKTLATGGSKVLLVDGDLRRGRLHRLLGYQNEVGLADLLDQSDGPKDVFQKNSHTNLTFLSRGANHPDPGNLFLSPKLDALLLQWRKEFDHVIIDTCPVFAVDDAATLAPKVDGILFIVCSGYSRFSLVNEAMSVLTQRQARILGIVYNRADTTGRSFHHYKYKEYSPDESVTQ